ncbi:GPP34 family phosphoprotein [Paractinoplanes durhamensis]|uniref:Golgi phosphoprotein 3 n=1 Tax=Paractinoplanes durhamensis TaxID=113563 RepID=A0ABQ3Z0N2_9ACTN|nr:GPP34 family phosphoprotein [Actinoplanes durhamensis]GIE03386.1 hypothetical protein Adu01nite_47360 [Actinoplanes durhamensis]
MSARLADELWLAAYDSVSGKPSIGVWPLGVGLAAGLLAELIRTEAVELWEGELFRKAPLCGDPALDPLLVKMEAEERDWSPVPSMQVAAEVGWGYPPSHGQKWPSVVSERRSLRPAAREAWNLRPAEDGSRRRSRGHQVRTWMSYLAYEHRAERLVVDRLARAGLVRREHRRRFFGGAKPRWVPYDSVVAGTPASAISTALQRGLELPDEGLMLAGLLLATGLHHLALATLTPLERAALAEQMSCGLHESMRHLLQAANAAVGEAAMR